MTRKETKKSVTLTLTKEEASLLSKAIARLERHCEQNRIGNYDVSSFFLQKEEQIKLLELGLTLI